MSQLKFEVRANGGIITATNDHDTMQLAWVTAFTQAIEQLKVDGDNKILSPRSVEVYMYDENRKVSVTVSTDKINPEGE